MSRLDDSFFDVSDRQLVLLALAQLALDRPGFDFATREIARRLHGEEVFDNFKALNADRFKSLPWLDGKARKASGG